MKFPLGPLLSPSATPDRPEPPDRTRPQTNFAEHLKPWPGPGGRAPQDDLLPGLLPACMVLGHPSGRPFLLSMACVVTAVLG